jgi:hypothetical protein
MKPEGGSGDQLSAFSFQFSAFSNQQSWESKVEGREPSRLQVTRQIPRMRAPKGAAQLCGSKVPSIEG